MAEPSVLTYARYFNLTRDHTLHNPLDLIDTIITRPSPAIASQESDARIHNLTKKFERAAEECVSLANDDPLLISQDATQYLKQCASHSVPNFSQIYKDLLPDPYRVRKLKLELPLLIIGGGDVRKDVTKIRRSVDLGHVLDDFLQAKEDERDRSSKDKVSMPSNSSADFLEWTQGRVRELMHKEKMDITREGLEYLMKTLSTPMSRDNILGIMRDLLPPVASNDTCDAFPISADDFVIEDWGDLPETSSPSEQSETNLEEPQSAVKQELDILGRLNLAVDEEIFLGSTQVDREMEELFQEYTYDATNDVLGESGFKVIDDFFDNQPAAKELKLEHKANGQLVAGLTGQAKVQDLDTTVRHLKLDVPQIAGNGTSRLPDVHIPDAIASGDRSNSSDKLLLKPPFPIPTIHEAICKSMPPASRAYERYLLDGKNILSSDKLLYKEPGLRLLDPNDEDERDLAASDFSIEEETGDLTTQQLENPSERQAAMVAATSSPPSSSDTKHAHSLGARKSTPRPWGQDFTHVPMSQGVTSADLEGLLAASDSLDTDLAASVPAHSSQDAQELSGNSLAHQPSRSDALLKSQTPPQSATDAAANKPVSDNDLASFRSLLPVSKPPRPGLNTPGKKEFKLDDSLASFLDLRGKQFKIPLPKQHVKQDLDMIDDPVQSTQDLPAEDTFTDQHHLMPSAASLQDANQQDTLPPIVPLSESRTIVVNNTLLQNKKALIQFLERPGETNLTLIYRDLDTGHYHGPDMILNATTCLLMTNLQSLNQRALPGQTSTTGLSSAHDQVAQLALSYSQIVVLIHHITSPEQSPQARTLPAQASFSLFCSDVSRSLSTSSTSKQVQPYWLPCPDPASTSKVVNAWVWQVIVAHARRNVRSAPPEDSTQPDLGPNPSTLIQDETVWELFLCKAGLNPMAAQIVLGSLRKPDRQASSSGATEWESEPTWGLRRLVAMGSRERTRAFADLIGLEAVKHLNSILTDTGHVK